MSIFKILIHTWITLLTCSSKYWFYKRTLLEEERLKQKAYATENQTEKKFKKQKSSQKNSNTKPNEKPISGDDYASKMLNDPELNIVWPEFNPLKPKILTFPGTFENDVESIEDCLLKYTILLLKTIRFWHKDKQIFNLIESKNIFKLISHWFEQRTFGLSLNSFVVTAWMVTIEYNYPHLKHQSMIHSTNFCMQNLMNLMVDSLTSLFQKRSTTNVIKSNDFDELQQKMKDVLYKNTSSHNIGPLMLMSLSKSKIKTQNFSCDQKDDNGQLLSLFEGISIRTLIKSDVSWKLRLRVCFECHLKFKSETKLRKCSGCQITHYCSKKCQKKSWNFHGHNCQCKAFWCYLKSG